MHVKQRARTALVTGAGRGIGKSVAVGLASSGWRVLVLDVGCQVDGGGSDSSHADTTAREITESGGTALAACTDITSPRDVDAAVDLAVEHWGSVDAVLNVAGILRLGNVLTTTDDDWERILAVHIRGSFNVARSAIRHWVETGAGYGRVVNFTSAAGIEGIPDMLAYSTAKAGVIGLTRSLSNSIAHLGYTVNAIAPSGRTRMAVRGLGASAVQHRESTGEWPSLDDRSIDPSDVVPLVELLLSDEAATFTGHVMTNYGPSYALLADHPAVAHFDGTGLPPSEIVARLAEQFLAVEVPEPRFRAQSLPGTDAYAFPVAELS